MLSQAPLFWLAVYLGVVGGVFSRDLVSPVFIALGLALGHLMFGCSLLITHRSWQDTWSYLSGIGTVWDFAMRSPMVLSRFLRGAIGEELIYRAVAQPIVVGLAAFFIGENYWSAAIGVGVVALLFVAIHHEFYSNSSWQAAEFIGFAILLGLLYHLSGSFILVTVIHAVRNIEIAHLEYLEKVETLGDEELASQEMEQEYMRLAPEPT